MYRHGVGSRSLARVAIVAVVCLMGAVVLPASALAGSSGNCINPSPPSPVSQPCSITTTSLAPGAVGSTYSAPLASAGMFPPVIWVINSGRPPGLNAISLGTSDGTVSGTPTAGGTYEVAVTAVDVWGNVLQVTLPLNVLGITPPTLPPGAIDTPYTVPAPTTVGASAPVTWSASGLAGTGLTINPSTGAISGTPTSVPSTITLTATDTTNHLSTSVPLSLPILDIASTSLPGGLVNSPYSASPVAVGDTSPLTWTASGLPAGLSINEFTGQITGTPTSAGNATVTITVADAAHRLSVSSTLPLTVLGISTTSLPGGTVGSPYSAPVSAVGGAAPLSWSATGLPAGLSIDPSTGVISGTPTSVENNVVTVTATDHSGVQATVALALNIAAPTVGRSPVLSLSGPLHVTGTTVKLTLSCAGAPCSGTELLTVIEKVRGSHVLAVSASDRTKTRRRRVVVGRTSFYLTAGQRRTIVVKLNHTGLALLRRLGRLPAHLTVALNHGPTIISRNVKVTPPRKRPPKHHH